MNKETKENVQRSKAVKNERQSRGTRAKTKVSPTKKEKGKSKEVKKHDEFSEEAKMDNLDDAPSGSPGKKRKRKVEKRDMAAEGSKEKNRGTSRSKDKEKVKQAEPKDSDHSNSDVEKSDESLREGREDDSIAHYYSDESSDSGGELKKKSKRDEHVLVREIETKGKGKSKGMDGVSTGKVPDSEEFLETQDDDYFMTSPKRSRPLKINLCGKSGIMDMVRKTLQGDCEARFRATCFGHFLDFSFKKTSSQLLHHLIQHQCKPKKTSELNFKIGGKVLKFGLREFALVTGLNCGPLPEINIDLIKEKAKLKNDYFEDEENVTRACLNLAFKFSKNACEEDKVKMAQLYCLESLLLPRQERVYVEQDHLLMVDDEELFNTYPWGRVSFQLLLRYMKNAVVSQGTCGIGMGGFIYALLAWAYEVIPALSAPPTFYARRIRNTVPRLINWEADTQPEWRELQANIFKSPSLEVMDLEPTIEELGMPYFEPFLKDELAKRRVVEHGMTIEGDNASDKRFFVGSSSMEAQMGKMFKKQDETNAKLEGVVSALNKLVAYLRTTHGISGTVDDQSGFKDGAPVSAEVETDATEPKKADKLKVDDHGVEKLLHPSRKDDDDCPPGGHQSHTPLVGHVDSVTVAPMGADGKEGGPSVTEGSAQEHDDIEATINQVISSIDETSIMERFNKEKKIKPLKLGKRRPPLVELNKNLPRDGGARGDVPTGGGFVGAMRGSHSKKTLDDLPVQFCQPTFDLKLSQQEG